MQINGYMLITIVKWSMMFKVYNKTVLEQQNLVKFNWNCPAMQLAAMMNSSSLPNCNLKLKNNIVLCYSGVNTDRVKIAISN